MPSARRVLAATGLFAAVVSASIPAVATPGTHGHGRTVRTAMAGQSVTAAGHGAGHKPVKAHTAHRVPGKKTKTVTVSAATTATGSSGRTASVHTAHRAVRRASTATTNHHKHHSKGVKAAVVPVKITPTKAGPTTGKPAKSTGRTPAKTATQPTATQPTATQPTATQPTATQPTATKPAATSQPRAAFGEAVPLSLGRRTAVSPPPARPGAPVTTTPTPKPSTSTTTNAGSSVPPALSPRRIFGDIGQKFADLTGIGLFSGPRGWIFTGMLLMAVVMLIGAFALGRRPKGVR